MDGWFKLYRKIFENGIWKNPHEFRMFIWILGNAVYHDKGEDYGQIKVSKGQYLRSYRKLAEDLEYFENNKLKRFSLSRIKHIINALKKKGIIETVDTELGTLITVSNYQAYQSFAHSYENKHRTCFEHTLNNTNKYKNNKNNTGVIKLRNIPEGAC